VELASGNYGAQSVPDLGARVGPAVEFRAAPGATVSMSALSIDGDRVSVRDVAVSGSLSVAATGDGVRDVRLFGVSARTLWLQNAHRVAFFGGSFGGNQDGPTVQIADDPTSSDLSFDGVDFHDAVATYETVHMECIWAAAVQGFTVRNSIFRNCALFNIFFTKLKGPDPKDVLLENNVFEPTKQWNGQGAPYAINVANWLSKAENFVFRNNVFGGDVAIQPTTISNMRLVGNIGEVASCTSGVVYSHNVFTSASCSETDKEVAGAMAQFVNPAGHDWRLSAGAAAIDSGDPADSPATDRNGYARIGAPDAGAHEYGAGPSDTQSPSARSNAEPSEAKRRADALSRIRAVGLSRARICRRPSARCPGTTRLRVRLTARAKLTVAIARRQADGRWRRVVSFKRAAQRGLNSYPLNARRLPRGRYRLVVREVGANGQAPARQIVRLRVR
jgi:hypothetical protein